MPASPSASKFSMLRAKQKREEIEDKLKAYKEMKDRLTELREKSARFDMMN